MADITTRLSGIVTIGTQKYEVAADVPKTLPKDGLTFTYTDDHPIQNDEPIGDHVPIPLGKLIKWVADNTGMTLSTASLPQTLQTFTLILEALTFKTKGSLFDFKVQMGNVVEGKWKNTWQPITGFPFTVGAVKLEVKREATQQQ